MLTMAKSKKYRYIVDNLDASKADVIAGGLRVVRYIEAVKISVSQGIVEVLAAQNPESNVEIACQVAGAAVRTRIKKKRF